MKSVMRVTCLVAYCFASHHILWCQGITSIVTGDSSRIFIAASGRGILRSEDNGVHWLYTNKDLEDSTAVNLLAYDNRGNLFSTTFYRNVYHSTNNGDNWTLEGVGLPIGDDIYCLAPNTDGQLFAGNNAGLFRQDSPRGGWTKISDNLLYNPSVISMTVTDSGRIFIGSVAIGPNGVVPITYLSTDHGDSWVRSDSGRLYYGMMHVNEDTILAGGYNTGLYRSTNGGVSWSMLGISNSYILSFAMDNRYVYIGSNSSQGVFRMLHSGDSLLYMTTSPPSVHSLANVQHSTILAGANSGLYASTDNGNNWRAVNITTSIEEPMNNRPNDFLLEQNYPNPFNPTTIIRFHLPHTGAIEMKLFDVLGREISTLIDGVIDAGNHETRLNAGMLASGVYICQARYMNNVQNIRLVLIK